jgi:hypothetical protein
MSRSDGKLTEAATARLYNFDGWDAIFEGDSYSDVAWSATQGSIGAGNSWPEKLMGMPALSAATPNYVATQGNTIADITSQYATQVYPLRPAATGKKGALLFVLIGTNSVSAGTSAATMQTQWDSYLTTARADGFTIVAFTFLSRSGEPSGNVTLTVNDYIRSSQKWDYLIDLAYYFQNPGETRFIYDNIHLNASGLGFLARIVNAVLIAGGSEIRMPRSMILTLPGTGLVGGRGTLELDSTAPDLVIRRSSSGVDAKIWAWTGTTANKISLSAINDARTSANAALTITRSGTTISSVEFGAPIIWSPGASVTPANNGQVTVELTNNTTLTFKAKGSDGTVRSATLTLA